MTRHHSRDIETRLEIYEHLLSCRSFDDLEREILAPLADYLDAETSCFLQFLPDADGALRIGRNACQNVSKNSHGQYTSHYFRLDPAIETRLLQQDSRESVFCTSEVCDYSEFVRGELYNEFLQPNHIHHVLVMMMQPDAQSTGRLALGFHRPKSVTPFGDAQKTRARRMASAACGAIRSLSLQDALELRDETISQFEAAHPETGVLFFDAQGMLLYGNPKGLNDIRLGKCAEAPVLFGRTRLARVLAACRELQATRGANRSMKIEISADEDVTATVQARQTPRGEFLFVVHTMERRTEAVLQRRCAEFGMTRREVDAVRLLSAGLSNGEIAARLFISPRTVENHFRSIYAKAGVNSRAQLLSQIMR